MTTLSELITTLKGKMLPLTGGTLSGNLEIGGNATVSGKNIVRSINGTVAGTDGNVTLSIPSAYKHPNSGVTAGTYNNVTVNAQGHVTAGSNVSVVSVPVGAVIAYAANSAPDGYLLCNGAAVSRTTYENLFAKIGTTYGSGNGSTTFNLPNLTDKFIQGSGTAGTTKSAGLPNITGSFWEAGEGGSSKGAFYNGNDGSGWVMGGGGGQRKTIYFKASRCSSIYGNSSTVQPPALTMCYYIKY